MSMNLRLTLTGHVMEMFKLMTKVNSEGQMQCTEDTFELLAMDKQCCTLYRMHVRAGCDYHCTKPVQGLFHVRQLLDIIQYSKDAVLELSTNEGEHHVTVLVVRIDGTVRDGKVTLLPLDNHIQMPIVINDLIVHHELPVNLLKTRLLHMKQFGKVEFVACTTGTELCIKHSSEAQITVKQNEQSGKWTTCAVGEASVGNGTQRVAVDNRLLNDRLRPIATKVELSMKNNFPLMMKYSVGTECVFDVVVMQCEADE